MKYFAYGSNMSSKRMYERKIDFSYRESGILKNYKLVINKISYKNPEIGFANIIKDNESEVEGIIYDVNEKDIKKLDKYEGYPKHYSKYFIEIKSEDDKYKNCLIYIANPEWVVTGEIKTMKGYKDYILEGKDFLSEKYYEKLKNIETNDKK